jgi:transposase
MTTIAHDAAPRVIGGVDTHKDIHVAAAIDDIGRLLGTECFAATAKGYRALWRWLEGHGEVVAVGIEGTSSWGAGLTRHLAATTGARILEVNRPDRQDRRRRGKSDPFDAEAAARAVLADKTKVIPKSGDGPVEAVRHLRIARSSAVKATIAAANQLHSLRDTAPEEIRAQILHLSVPKMVALAVKWRPGPADSVTAAAKISLASVARRWRSLKEEVAALDREIKAILNRVAPALLAVHGVGYATAGQLLITAGDNAGRLKSESSFAALCGVSPVPASSGKTRRHRLNKGGDRQANCALYMIVVVRMGTHAPTRDYVERRTKDGLSKPEIMRCLKRYVARELFPLVRAIAEPRTEDQQLRISA